MAIPYVKIEQFTDYIPALLERGEETKSLEAALFLAISDASRLFETDAGLSEDYFSIAPEEAIEKYFYGSGTSYLRLPPFLDLEYVHDFYDEVIEAEQYQIGTFFIKSLSPRNCGTFYWRKNLFYKIKARWGFTCVPANVQAAVKAMALLMFLLIPFNRKGFDLALSDNLEARLRNNYNRIVGEYRERNRHKGVFLGIG